MKKTIITSFKHQKLAKKILIKNAVKYSSSSLIMPFLLQ